MSLCLPQLPACDEPLHAALHDSGLDVLGGDHPEERGVRERGTAEGDHEDYGIGQRYPVVQLVHQQPDSSVDQRRPAGAAAEGDNIATIITFDLESQ